MGADSPHVIVDSVPVLSSAWSSNVDRRFDLLRGRWVAEPSCAVLVSALP